MVETISQKKLEELVDELSKKYFDKPFIDEVMFNNRLRTTGGRYIPSRRTIELNPKFLTELGQEEFIGIIKHELCHYHLHIEGKGYKHRDPDFRELLRKTGSPRFCQALPSARKQTRHRYQCRDCGHIYERARRVDTKKYRCGRCRGKLVKVSS